MKKTEENNLEQVRNKVRDITDTLKVTGYIVDEPLIESKELKNQINSGLPDDKVKEILKKYPAEKEDDLNPFYYSNIITHIELENLEILKTTDKLSFKISNLIKDKELVELDYQQDIFSPENKKLYPNEGSRNADLKDLLSKDEKYNNLNDIIFESQKDLTGLEYKKKKNNILISNFKRVYDIKMRDDRADRIYRVEVGNLSADEISEYVKEFKKRI